MPDIFLGTLGKRPEAITVALDLLRDRYSFSEIVILHTEPNYSGIAEALPELRAAFERECQATRITWHELTYADGAGILDVDSQTSAIAYYTALLRVLLEYKQKKNTLHLMVAGGRKAMSIYAALAATLLFDEHDRVWTVLSPEEMLKPGLFQIPAGWRDKVQVVNLPILPARLAPDSLASMNLDSLTRQLEIRKDRRIDFLTRLSTQERRIAETLMSQPDAQNSDLAELLGKSERTVENQLRAIYDKLSGYFDFTAPFIHKRQTLINFLLANQQ